MRFDYPWDTESAAGQNASIESKQAAEKLASLGYTNVFAYEGGLKDWSEAGLPLVKHEVDLCDYVLLEIVRLRFSGIYDDIWEHRWFYLL